jgi:multidrug transporter EmrE-like cation transporter
MNIGVIALGAITGLVIFRERLSTLNKAGILLAIAAVVILTYSQIH